MNKDQYIRVSAMEKQPNGIPNTAGHNNDTTRHGSRRRHFLFKLKRMLSNNLLLFLTIAGVFIGFGSGFAIRETHPTEDALMWIGLPGQLYLRLLKMMIVPLIACSVVGGAAALDPKSNGKISLIALIFVLITNGLGSALGIGAAVLFKPGKTEIMRDENQIQGNMQTTDILADLIRNIIPDNLFEATFSQTQTKYRTTEKIIEDNSTGTILNRTVIETTKYLGKMGNPNIIGLIFACTLLGIAAANLKEKGKSFLDFIQSTSETVLLVVRWFMWTTPIGVISLIAVSIASIDDVQSVFAQLGMFIITVTVGIAIQQIIIMPAILFVFGKKNPFTYMISIARPWFIAFAATSTAVAIPEMLIACEEKNKIDKRIARFVVPFSVTISCNGSALYIAAATTFLANLSGIPLTFGDILLIWLLVTIAAMAIPSVPSASIMTTLMILTAMNIPADDIALLLAIEWYLDRIRSTSSVVSHTFCAAVVYNLCKSDLDKLDEKLQADMTRNETAVTMVDDTGSNDDSINELSQLKINGTAMENIDNLSESRI